jgi:hypothetical protein
MSIPVKLSFGNSKRRPGQLGKLQDVLKFIESCPEFPPYFFLKYKDDENDVLTMSSEKEFSEALQLCQKQKLLQIECVEAASTDPAALKKGATLANDADDEPFQIISGEEKPVESTDNKAHVIADNKSKPVENALVKALDQKSTVAAINTNSATTTIVQAAQPPLELLDALLANLSGHTTQELQTVFRNTRAAFLQELASAKSEQLDQKTKPKEQDKKEVTATTTTTVEQPKADKPAVVEKKEEKRNSKSEKPALTRPTSKYQKQLDELEAMGFSADPIRNEALLKKYDGNVSKTINVLIHT